MGATVPKIFILGRFPCVFRGKYAVIIPFVVRFDKGIPHPIRYLGRTFGRALPPSAPSKPKKARGKGCFSGEGCGRIGIQLNGHERRPKEGVVW